MECLALTLGLRSSGPSALFPSLEQPDSAPESLPMARLIDGGQALCEVDGWVK